MTSPSPLAQEQSRQAEEICIASAYDRTQDRWQLAEEPDNDDTQAGFLSLAIYTSRPQMTRATIQALKAAEGMQGDFNPGYHDCDQLRLP